MRTLIILLLLIPFRLFSSYSPFMNFDFSNGGYTIYGIKELSTTNKLANKLDNFSVTDISLLNEFKKEWTFETNKLCVCDFDYFIHIVRNDSIVGGIAISFECNRIIASDNKCYYFDFATSKVLQNEFAKLKMTNNSFKDLSSARESWKKQSSQKNVFTPLASEFYWFKHTGYIEFQYSDTLKLRDLERIKDNIVSVIKQKLPKDNFDLECFTHSETGAIKKPDVYVITMYCEQDVGLNFNVWEKSKEWQTFKDIQYQTYEVMQ